MKFTCEKNAFSREISLAQEIIASKNALSIMSNVYLEAVEDGLIVKATDIKTGFKTKIPVEVSEPGAITVFCDKLSGIIANIPEGTIEFEDSDDKVTIKPSFKKVKFQLKTISSEKFPELPELGNDKYFSVPARDIKDMIRQTAFAVSDDETRYFMNGVFLEKTHAGIVLVATDGRRLAYTRKDMVNIPDFKGVIIPPKILYVILKHAGDEGPVDIAVGEKNIFIKFGSYHLSSVIIEGQFPNYQKVIPENQQYSLILGRQDFIDALKRVSIFVEQKSNRTFCALSNDLLTIYSEETELGTAREEIACKYSGPDITIALNYKYLEDPLKAHDSHDIRIDFTEANRAITIKPEPEQYFFHIVMPMQFES